MIASGAQAASPAPTTPDPPGVRSALVSRYRGIICDLDGVVYRGPEPVPGAIDTLNALVEARAPVAFATNNSSRTPGMVADHLRRLGLGGAMWSVVTSSQVAADYLAERLPADASILAVGGHGVVHALEEAGFMPLRALELAPETAVDAVVQGAGLDVSWRDLAEAAFAVQRGATWVATNTDPTIPTARGPAPGNGTLVAAVRTAAAAEPHVSGKPGPALFELARRRLGTASDRTLVIGDRLDTDVRGAHAAGLNSMLVLSGACSLREVAVCPPDARPTHVAQDLRGLLAPVREGHEVGDELVRVRPDGSLVIARDAPATRLLQAVVATAWQVMDAGRSLSEDGQMWAVLEAQLSAAQELARGA